MKKLLSLFVFIFCFTLSYSHCIDSVKISVSPLPFNGTYSPGTVVTFTLIVYGYADSGAFHGLVLNFKNNWDANSVKPISAAASEDGFGEWKFFKADTDFCSQQPFGNGFYYDRGFALGDTGDGIPGFNSGDFCVGSQCTWSFSWSVAVDSNAVCGQSLIDSIQPTNDGLTGDACYPLRCLSEKYTYPSATVSCTSGIFFSMKQNTFSVSLNPCTTCQISSVSDITDLQVMDLLGRNVTASFTKSSGNIYQMNLPNRNGLFFIRDIKTGAVVKFVKE